MLLVGGMGGGTGEEPTWDRDREPTGSLKAMEGDPRRGSWCRVWGFSSPRVLRPQLNFSLKGPVLLSKRNYLQSILWSWQIFLKFKSHCC